MILCRYAGGDATSIGEMEYSQVGQYAEFSEEQFRDVILGGGVFLPVDQFAKIGFTESELEEFGPPGSRDDAEFSFNEKLIRARQAYFDLRNGIVNGEPDAVASVEAPTPAPAATRSAVSRQPRLQPESSVPITEKNNEPPQAV